MSQLRRIMWPKLKSSITRTGGSSSEDVNNVRNKLNVYEEYKETFRTRSYMKLWSKVQGHLMRTNSSTANLSDFLLEPPQDILMGMITSSNLHFHHLLFDYFECSLEACKICGLLLQSIDETRTNYSRIQRIINLSDCSDYSDDECLFIFRELASFAKLDNTISDSNPVQFQLIRNKYGLILDQLTSTQKKITRKAKLIALSEKAIGVCLVIVCGALAAATIVLTVHSIVGIAASPVLLSISLAALKERIKSSKGLNTRILVRFCAQLDAAAKGVYILNMDFDTMSRLVTKLHDEIEHVKTISRMCVSTAKKHMLMEVVREFKDQESCFLEQLEELEKHVYLCFLTINRSRRLVIQEIMRHHKDILDSLNLDNGNGNGNGDDDNLDVDNDYQGEADSDDHDDTEN